MILRVLFVGHFSFPGPFLVSRATEHSGNIPARKEWRTLTLAITPAPPVARVGTVYGAKRMIECEMCAIYDKGRLHGIIY